ncbi:MAG: esterase [Bacteroidetes bacterium]|nr:esterase [Bacteroidota bacterium]
MKYRFVLCWMLSLATLQCAAQYHIQIELTRMPLLHQQDGVFIAGSFNNWNPADEKYRLQQSGNTLLLHIAGIAAGTYHFKFTRGGWDKVETNEQGGDIGNREIIISSDTVLRYTVAGWHDDFSIAPVHTASRHVKVMDTAFNMPQLGRTRKIWIYLPEGYAASQKHYPVLYMQDGQSLFDNYTSAFGNEWGVDEWLDSLIAKGTKASIVVAIENNGATRMNEYNPYLFTLNNNKDSARSQTFTPEGKEYADFLVNTLKPYVDGHYRTLRDKENTMIAGSSMGGLISYYTALEYPDVFGKAGIFSPSFWTAPAVNDLTDSIGKKVNGKFFFYVGEKEGGSSFVNDMTGIAEKLGEKSGAMIYEVVDPAGSHNETAWRKWFGECYQWMMADGFNRVIKIDE